MSVKLKVKGNSIHLNEHYLLNGLERANQHPIAAIIGLEDELKSKYVIPENGIPDSDLEEKYLKYSDYNKDLEEIRQLYADTQISYNMISEKFEIVEENVNTNVNDIIELNNKYEILKSMIESIDIGELTASGATCIKQETFTATDNSKQIVIEIEDTDLKVIEPTVLHSDGSAAIAGMDYTLEYISDTKLQITFTTNDEYKINYISGELTETEYNLLLKEINNIKNVFNDFGGLVNPSSNIDIDYNADGYVVKETYTGDVNKTVEYEYDSNNNIVKKIVSDGDTIRTAVYTYNNNKLTNINDNGTDILVDGTKGLKYSVEIEYNASDLIAKETFTGDINKIVEYTYNSNNDVVQKKVTENDKTSICSYIYDGRKLVRVVDEGTEKIAIAFKEITVTENGTLTDEEIDQVFNSIFKEE